MYKKAKIISFTGFHIFSYDATYSNGLAKYVNDSLEDNNCVMKKKVFQNRPYLCLYASKDIPYGIELRYDYGDNDENLWWRHNVSYNIAC